MFVARMSTGVKVVCFYSLKIFSKDVYLLCAVAEWRMDESEAKEMTGLILPVNAHDSIDDVHEGACEERWKVTSLTN